MKSLLLLWKMAAEELGSWCHTSTIRDLKTVADREQHEGDSFFTITLPAFGSGFQKSLESGQLVSASFPGFRFRGGLPVFLQGFTSRVFARDGRLLDEPDVDAVFAVRQLTLMFSKILLPCSEERERAAYDKYIECEKDVRTSDSQLPVDVSERFTRIGRLLFADLFTHLDHKVYSGELVPRHGPGATADGIKANQKFNLNTWTQRLEVVFPSVEYLVPSYSFWREAQGVTILEPGAEIPAKVITVPKTLKTPRIIAMEPSYNQYVQQAILEVLVDRVERDEILYDFIGFGDQVSNQRLAREGSVTGSLATLDLSEASDRVSAQHVWKLLGDHPHLLSGVDACRSRKAEVPGHGVIRLAKFASMGSALCFPFEAMVFLTVCFLGIEETLSRRLTKKDIQSYRGRVRVYGDDIIVPTDMVESVVRSLETFGFKVNRGKSFWNGKFRESCGKEYFRGRDVSITRVRRVLPTQRSDSQELVSTVALRNHFFLAGMYQCARHLDDILEKFLKLPKVLPTSPSLGLYTFGEYDTHRVCPDTQRPLVRGYAVVPRIPRSRLGGMGALLKSFLKRGKNPHEEGHLERSGRPTSVDIKRRWIPAY